MPLIEDTDSRPQAKRPKIDLPTKDEQKNLQQVESLLRSNLLQLQVSELLNQIRSEKHFDAQSVRAWIKQLEEDLQSDSLDGTELSAAWLEENGLSSVGLSKHASESVNFTFQHCTTLEVVGSRSSYTATAPLLNIDIAITLPTEMFDTRYD